MKFIFVTSNIKEGQFKVLEFAGEESLSMPYHFTIRLQPRDESFRPEPEKMVMTRAGLTWTTRTGKERNVRGLIKKHNLEGTLRSHHGGP